MPPLLHWRSARLKIDCECRSRNKEVDLIAVVTRQFGKSNIEPFSKLMISNYSGRTHLMPVWQAKSECDRGSCHIGDKTLHKNPLRGEIQYATIPSTSVRFTPGAQSVFALSSVPG
jgi:hypothetical protein